MYCDFYQLTERPFNVTPDPKFLYLNARYREAIASLNYGITQRKGFITLIGEAGTGKTTLLKRLLEDLDAKTKSVFIFNTNVTFEEILEYIFAEFDLPVHNGKKLYMLQRLNTFLLEELRGGCNVALLIDEAQDLEFSVLEDLRLLSNLETAKEKILQIVLSGQPELGQKLSNPVLRQLRQRIGINCRLLPLSRDEITEYIRFRLQAAGCPDLKLFSREAEDQVYHFSRGIPRLVNVVCDNALVIGYALGKKRIGADLITEAAADLLSVEPVAEDAPSAHPPTVSASRSAATPQSRWRARFGVISLVLTAVVVGLLSVGRTMLHKRADDDASSPVASQTFEVIRPGTQPLGTGVGIPVAGASDGFAAPRPVADIGGGVRPQAAEPQPIDIASARPADRVVQEVPLRAEPPDDQLPLTAPPAAPERGTATGPPTHPVPVPGRRLLTERELPARVEAPTGIEVPVRLGERERNPVARRPDQAGPAPAVPPVAAPKATDAPSRGTVNRNAELARVDEDAAVRAWQHRDVSPHEALRPPQPPRGEAPPVDAATAANTGAGAPHLDGVQFATQVVRVGDSMSSIAVRKYGQATYTVLDLLKLANPELDDIDAISVGQTIRLPELSEGFPILTEANGRYALLVYSTPHASHALNLQRALRSHGFGARVTGGSVGYQKPVFRVVVSGFADREEVARVGQQLQKLFREDAQIADLGE